MSSKDRAEEHFLLACDTLSSDRLSDSSYDPITSIFRTSEQKSKSIMEKSIREEEADKTETLNEST